jgi:hypothetical protein
MDLRYLHMSVKRRGKNFKYKHLERQIFASPSIDHVVRTISLENIIFLCTLIVS